MRAVRFFSLSMLLFSGLIAPTHTASGQTLPPLNGFTAGAEAAARGEDQRLQATARQLETVDSLSWWAGIPPRPGAPLPWSNPPMLDYIYATNRWTTSNFFGPPRWAGPPRMFEPWPVVPGDIWGYRYVQLADQPVGFFSGQTGPNRWEYRPIYAREALEVAPRATVAMPQSAVVVPQPEPASSQPTGPREF